MINDCIGDDTRRSSKRMRPLTNGASIDFEMLDVGCGSKPKGDVNVDFFQSGFNPQTGDQIQGEFMSPKKTRNFIVSDAMNLPFKDGAFEVVFSSHTIEHVKSPSVMLREMCRVAKRKVIIRFPHRKGSGAKMPHHLNYLDENWFKRASDLLGFRSTHFVTAYEGLITSSLRKICPRALQSTLPWRALGRFERSRLGKKLRLPFEMEVWIRKQCNPADSAKVKFIVVYNIPKFFKLFFSSSPYVPAESVIAYHNINKEPLSRFFNKTVQEHLQENVWFVFCHQDYVLKEDLQPRLKGKNFGTIFGPIGARLSGDKGGRIIQTDGTPVGRKLDEDTPVQTLDEMCLIAHSEVFRQGLMFDERFPFHFYGADLCMQAYKMGFDVMAMQLECQHKSRTLQGDLASSEYLSSLDMFKEKWKQFLPVRTTTRLIT